jgi:hypothetical protein
MQEVRLRNGSSEAAPLVAATLLSLRSLLSEDPISASELVCVARDPTHKLSGKTGDRLREWALLEHDGKSMHASVRNIILSAVEGEGFDLRLISPVQEEED